MVRGARSKVPPRFGGTRREPEPPYSYPEWLAAHRAERFDGDPYVGSAAPPDVAVFVLDGADAARTLASVDAQTWAHRRVELVRDDAATTIDEHVADLAPDALVIVLRAGDELEPDAFARIVDRRWCDPAVELVTWDDDVGGASPRFRGGWVPESAIATDEYGRSFASTADAFRRAGGLGSLGDARWWDLLLRADVHPDRAAHVPHVLTHLGARGPSVPDGAEVAVNAWLDRRAWPATATRRGSSLALDWRQDLAPTVSIVIPSRHNRPMLRRLLPTLLATDHPSFDVTIVDNSGHTDDKARWYDDHRGDLDLRVVWWTDEPFNYAAVNNAGAAATTGDVIVFLNDDTEAPDPGWLTDLVGWATRPEIGLAGAALLFDDGTIQHAGVRVGHNGLADHYFLHVRPGTSTIAGTAGATRGVTAVTGACAAIRREVFDAIGGFDEHLVLTGNDVDLSLDAVRAGLRNVVTSGATLHHHESVTRGRANPWADAYRTYWRVRYWAANGDPRFSPNLRLIGTAPELRRPDDLSSIGLLERHFRRRLDPRHDDGAPTTRDVGRWIEALRSRPDPAAVAAVTLDRVGTVNWVATSLRDPWDATAEFALRCADALDAIGVRSRFVLTVDDDPYWYGSIVSGRSRRARPHEVVTVGRSVDLTIPPADVHVAVDDRAGHALALAGAAAPRRWLPEQRPELPIDDVAPVLVAVPTPGMPTVVFDVVPWCHDDDWRATAAATVELKRRLGDAVRVVVIADVAPPAGVNVDGATLLLAPDRRGFARFAAGVDLVVPIESPETSSRWRGAWRSAGVPVLAIEPSSDARTIADAVTAALADPPPPPTAADPVDIDVESLLAFLRGDDVEISWRATPPAGA